MMILVDKVAGMTSFGVVARVRRKLSEEAGRKVKVGHTGTLDPFATGLLILMTGPDTKRCGEFLKLDKEYEATLRLGAVSTTGDPEGEISICSAISSSSPSSRVSSSTKTVAPFLGPDRTDIITSSSPSSTKTAADIATVLKSFVGKIRQRPPKFSAVKVNGQRAYKLARKGEDFELPEREVTIYNIEVLEYKYPELKIRVACSSGTYIRSLAEDIGEALGVGAYLTALRRTKVGKYSVEEAEKI